MTLQAIQNLIETYQDFPKPGIGFKDISPVLENPDAFHSLIGLLQDKLTGLEFDLIAGIDARGFIFASALAYAMGKGLVMVRKADKLPGELLHQAYKYEYAEAELTIQKQNVRGHSFVIIDDVLATGNSATAVVKLIEQGGGTVAGILTVIDLPFLQGKAFVEQNTQLSGEDIMSLLQL